MELQASLHNGHSDAAILLSQHRDEVFYIIPVVIDTG